MPLFFLAPDAVRGDTVTITGPLVRHIGGALRYQIGDRLAVADADGERCLIELTAVGSAAIHAVIRRRLGPAPEPAVHLTLAQAVLKSPNIDLVFQKATELGVQRVVPLMTRRSVVRLKRERESRQLARWRAIVLEAAQQSERGRVPHVDPPKSLPGYLAEKGDANEARLLLWEDESILGLHDYLNANPSPRRATLLVGPEGGFDADEVRAARAAGFVAVSLGDAVLRAETAAPAALAILQYAWGGLGRRPTQRAT